MKKKSTWVFFFYKYGKFWWVLPEQKVDLNLFFLKSEVGEEEHAVTNSKKDNKKVYENPKSTYKLRSTYLHKYMY